MNRLRTDTSSSPPERRRRRALLVAALVPAVVALLVVGGALIGWAVAHYQSDERQDDAGSSSAEEERNTDSGDGTQAAPTMLAHAKCPSPTVDVTTAHELQEALDSATPGDVIGLAPGQYVGEFTASVDGEPETPITLCGTPESVLDGDGIKKGYVVHLDHVANWVLQGFAVQNGQKGVMADGTTKSVIRGLQVSGIGDEAIHLRAASSDNLVIGNAISDTGLRKPKFGEGIYIGTAESNWCDISDCDPDPSDRNVIEGNTISRTTSESVDIKEGTSDGILRGNTFDGAALVEADSWVDVKGNDWVIEGNTGANSAADGFQTHEILDGWGTRNVFRNNTAQLSGSGLAFSLKPERDNVVECNNTISGDAVLSNVTCRG
ncbi:right-handed parallel beta-helix repeat-containing protein [Agromyces humi]|uniref:right-handed parallel beta-helix repeat-containing protein n=1 Tax=Agromyces humi TaxID=1766800 RepID=UPI00135742F2|nr:right-handed parallel beta-helix repeat-containing protein [Agromyces humi]